MHGITCLKCQTHVDRSTARVLAMCPSLAGVNKMVFFLYVSSLVPLAMMGFVPPVLFNVITVVESTQHL